jgi:hypothetical protein
VPTRAETMPGASLAGSVRAGGPCPPHEIAVEQFSAGNVQPRETERSRREGAEIEDGAAGMGSAGGEISPLAAPVQKPQAFQSA